MTSTNNNTSISAQVDERKKKWGNDIYAFDAYANKDKYADYGYSSADDFMAAYKNDLDYVTRFDTATLAKQEAEQAAQKAESQKLQYADTRRQLMEKYIPETLLAQGIANTGYTADALLKMENTYNQYATNAMNTRAETEQNILKDYQTTLKNMQKDYTDTAYKNFLEQNERESASAVDTANGSNYIVKNPQLSWDAVTQYLKTQGYSDETINGLKPMYDTSRNDYLVGQIDTYISNNPKKTRDEVIAYFEGLGANETTISKVGERYDNLHSQAEEEKEQNKEVDYKKIIDNAMIFVKQLGYDLDKIKEYAIRQGASEDIYPLLENKYNEYIQSVKNTFDTDIQSFINSNPVQSWDDVKAKAESLGADESQLKEVESYYNKTKPKAIVDWAKSLMDDEENVYTLDDILFKVNEYAPSDETISEITKEYNKRVAYQQDKNYGELMRDTSLITIDELDSYVTNGNLRPEQALALKYKLGEKASHLTVSPVPSEYRYSYYNAEPGDNDAYVNLLGEYNHAFKTGAKLDYGSGFKTNKHDNFEVVMDGRRYHIEHGGTVDDGDSEWLDRINKAVKDGGIQEGDVFLYSGAAYLYAEGKIWKLQRRQISYPNEYRDLAYAMKDKVLETLRKEERKNNEYKVDVARGKVTFNYDGYYPVSYDFISMVPVSKTTDSSNAYAEIAKNYDEGEIFVVGDKCYVKKDKTIYYMDDSGGIGYANDHGYNTTLLGFLKGGAKAAVRPE